MSRHQSHRVEFTRSLLTQAADALISVCRQESRRARVAVARKLATAMLALWKSERDFLPTQPPAA